MTDTLTHQDTIVALSTAPGSAALAVIRVSGARAQAIALQHFAPASKETQLTPRRALYGRFIHADNTLIDELVLIYYQSPASFTGEDMLEISCHGSPWIVQQIMQQLIRSGCRPAEPGEFSRRAFLNGKMDLSQAEAISDLIQAETEFSHRLALAQMNGTIRNWIGEVRHEIIRLMALLEAELDFSDEEITPTEDESLLNSLQKLVERVEQLISSWRWGRMAAGVKVVITGPPNAGKSTLMNQLLKEDRVIVAPIPGTTRDAVSAELDLRGLRVTLWDTAGIQETEDPVEQQGINRSRQAVNNADLVLSLRTPDSEPVHDSLPHEVQVLEVVNKMDLFPDYPVPSAALGICAASGEGVDELLERIYGHLTDGMSDMRGEVVISNLRHRELLQQASEHLTSTISEIRSGADRSVLSIFLRDALESLGRIDGAFDIEEVLDQIFSRFCIGK